MEMRGSDNLMMGESIGRNSIKHDPFYSQDMVKLADEAAE